MKITQEIDQKTDVNFVAFLEQEKEPGIKMAVKIPPGFLIQFPTISVTLYSLLNLEEAKKLQDSLNKSIQQLESWQVKL